MKKNTKNSSLTKDKKNKELKINNIILHNLITIANEFATHFGKNCEICIHDLQSKDLNHTIVHIENGHVTNRHIGDAPSNAFLKNKNLIEQGKEPKNITCYTTRSNDGKFLKSSTIFLKDNYGKYKYMLCINQDVSDFLNVKSTIDSILSPPYDKFENEITIPANVSDLLESLINKAIGIIGKAPLNMTKDEKKKAIKFLNDSGAFLITGSGDIVSNCFNISKFTLYSYINIEKNK